MMTRAASKRAKMDVASRVVNTPSPDSESESVLARPPPFIPFQTGPSLEHIPDDILLEIMSHLATTGKRPLCVSGDPKSVIPYTVIARTVALRALSKTSRVLRSRCLALAWKNIELWGPSLRKRGDAAIAKGTESGIRVLEACSYLPSLIRTVSVILPTWQKAEIIPELAACLATLPNVDTLRVLFTGDRMQTIIKSAFRGKRFLSVRRVTLPSSAHEIIRRCPNVEEVMCVDGDGSKIVQSLVEGKCRQVRILRGISALLSPLADVASNLTCASVAMGSTMTLLTIFPFLDTIEILINYHVRKDLPLRKIAALDIKKAKEILAGSTSRVAKAVVLTQSKNFWDYKAYQFDFAGTYMRTKTFRL